MTNIELTQNLEQNTSNCHALNTDQPNANNKTPNNPNSLDKPLENPNETTTIETPNITPICPTSTDKPTQLSERFRKFLPVVVDVETAGFNAKTDALLEIAFLPILMDEQGQLILGEPLNAHIEPFEGANLEQSALDFTGIDPNNPMRKLIAEDEKTALRRIFKELKAVRKAQNCRQCVLIGHNAHFDLNFLNAAIERTGSKNHSPFHSFSVFDTVTLSAVAFGQTVLARACREAGIEFSNQEAHSALYDTIKTGELFCKIINSYPMLANAIADSDDSLDKEPDT